MKIPALALICALATGALCAPAARAQNATSPNAADLRARADAAFQEKSYARAIELYRQRKEKGASLDEAIINYNIATSLYKMQKWDEAIKAANYTLKNSDWKARVFYLLGQIYFKVPHQGYEVGGQIYRGQEYPRVAGAEKPVQKYLGGEDEKMALDFFEQAVIAAQKERYDAAHNRYFAPIYPIKAREEIDLNFDLAAFLPQTQFNEFILRMDKGGVGASAIDLKENYSTDWILPHKVLYLYAQIRVLDQAESRPDAARSLLAQGLFERAYQQRMLGWAQKYDPELKKTIVRPYPYDGRDALDSWRRLVQEFSGSDLAPRALLQIAQAQRQKGDLIATVKTLRELLAKYPKSKLVSDARADIAQIEKHEVTFYPAEPTRPGQKVKLAVGSRNVKAVQFTAYRVKLEDYLARADNLREPRTRFGQWNQNFGSIAAATGNFGRPVARWNYSAATKFNYTNVNGIVTAPLTQVGAYAIVAQADGVRAARIVIISDLALLKKVDKDGSFVFVANAKTGAAVRGANAVLKETWYDNSGKPRVDVARGHSNDGGFFDKKRAAAIRNNRQIEAFAWVGNRYAFTGEQGGYFGYGYGYGYNDDQQFQRALGTTDRPVYRPGQTVNFRQILTRRTGGDWTPLVGTSIRVQATDTKGEQVYSKTFKSSEFGTINDSFKLPDETPLGVYQISASRTDKNTYLGTTQFRVEEYKRPEFEVEVSAPTEAKRPGETVAARINAKYYFGAPVPNAKVKYTVRKSSWYANYRFPTPYDWLYASWGVGSYNTGRRNIGGEGSGKIVKEGEVTTDEKGFAELSFKTDELEVIAPNNWWARYSNPLYTIEAQVTDQSRRTIEAQGEVKVSRQQYFAFLDADRGYFQQGDRVPLELRTQDANEQPLAATGKMVVYRLLPGERQTKVFEEAISTNKEGRAFWKWEAKDSGQFRVEFQATDAWGQQVKAQQEIWVVGENIGALRLRGVTILLDKESYAIGESVRARLVADQPGATVLLTQEVGGEILRRDVYKIEGQSREVRIPLDKTKVPNFFLSAALAQDYRVYQAQAEVFVPPVRQLLKLEVKGDKEVYKPGETGTFQLTARDYAGQPVRAEVSLALTDASLFYIQKSFTPDAREFYYGNRRTDGVELDSSDSGNPQTRLENDRKIPKYERHGFDLPDGFGQLQLMPGNIGYYNYGYENNYAFADGHVMFARGAFANGAASDAVATAGAVPVAAPAAMQQRNSLALRSDGVGNKALAKEANGAPVDVRSNFAETAYWSPSIVTEGGKATLKVTFPDSLTQWHASALGLTKTVQVGEADADVATKKDLLVRLQAPRFFVERDEVTISANVHNYTDSAQNVTVNLATEGATQSLEVAMVKRPALVLQAGEEKRVDWPVKVVRSGEAQIQVTAQTATASDGVKMSFPVLVHGVQRFDGQAGLIKTDGATKIALNFPKERQLGASRLNLQLNPSLAAQMLEALPYLADYPYGCVEQTVSRFVPTVVAQKTLRQSGVDMETLRKRAQAYAAQAKDAPLGQRIKNSGYTYPQGQPNARDLDQMSSQLWYWNRSNNPIYDAKTIDRMTNEGLQRLYRMQRSDGGWGWWTGSDQSDPYMSAYVMYGLYQAVKSDVKVRGDILNRGRNYLLAQIKDEDNIHLLSYLAYSLSQSGNLPDEAKKIAAGRLFEQRDRLTPLTKAQLALALSNAGETEKAGVLVRNLENTAEIDAENGTARYRTQPQYWYWWNNDVETVALALRAFDQIDAGNKLAPMLMKWLTLQARGNHYRSTKETAEVVYTLTDYVIKHNELDVDYTIKVNLNGKLTRTYRVTKENALWFDNRFITGDVFLTSGDNVLTIEKEGKGNLYWNAYTEYFSLEEPIKASGNELEVSRRFFKLTRKAEPEKAELDATTTTTTTTTTTIVRGARFGRIMPYPRPVETEQEYSCSARSAPATAATRASKRSSSRCSRSRTSTSAPCSNTSPTSSRSRNTTSKNASSAT